MAVRELYLRTLAERGYRADEAQLAALDALERCEREWADYKARRSNAVTKMLVRPPIPRGVYMYGGVGRGKSFLMDCFFQSVPLVRKTRLHFHEFMREVHRELQELKGTVNPLDELGRRMARRFRLICFDEFHVADVTDAMILHRLLVALFANRVSIVTTSNFHPDELYPHGLHRDRILPAIELLKDRLETINVDHGTDYRQRTEFLTKRDRKVTLVCEEDGMHYGEGLPRLNNFKLNEWFKPDSDFAKKATKAGAAAVGTGAAYWAIGLLTGKSS